MPSETVRIAIVAMPKIWQPIATRTIQYDDDQIILFHSCRNKYWLKPQRIFFCSLIFQEKENSTQVKQRAMKETTCARNSLPANNSICIFWFLFLSRSLFLFKSRPLLLVLKYHSRNINLFIPSTNALDCCVFRIIQLFILFLLIVFA